MFDECGAAKKSVVCVVATGSGTVTDSHAGEGVEPGCKSGRVTSSGKSDASKTDVGAAASVKAVGGAMVGAASASVCAGESLFGVDAGKKERGRVGEYEPRNTSVSMI